ncbi:hypothetical protein CMV_011117 [Castanea mollissima]|uniref:Uncharacterized protein n=1 Tax=Castanea mollissima TaxID=60419 RepID=A0A8J4R4S1_9ROSI|nr:hypothetical protein CMV_011117 [Castanea mollissima]
MVSSLQTIRNDSPAQAQTPTDVSPKRLELDNLDFQVKGEVGQLKPNHKASVKGKKVLARAKASQASSIGAAEREQSSCVMHSHCDGESSFVVHSHNEIEKPISNGDQATCDGEGRPRSSGESKPRGTSQLHFASMAWSKGGYKFGGNRSGNCRGDDSKNLCQPDAKQGLGKQQAKEGREVGRGEESMVGLLGGCAFDEREAVTVSGSYEQEYHEANSSIVCNVSGVRDRLGGQGEKTHTHPTTIYIQRSLLGFSHSQYNLIFRVHLR